MSPEMSVAACARPVRVSRAKVARLPMLCFLAASIVLATLGVGVNRQAVSASSLRSTPASATGGPAAQPLAAPRTATALDSPLPADDTVLSVTGVGPGSGVMYFKYGTAAGYTSMGQPDYTNGFIGAPAVAMLPVQDGRSPIPYYFGVATNGQVYWRTPSFSSSPHGLQWRFLGSPNNDSGCLDNPAAVITGVPGQPYAYPGYTLLTLACEGTDHALWYLQAPLVEGSPILPSVGWTSLVGSLAAGPAVAQVNDVLTFFVLGTDNRVYSRTLSTGYVYTGLNCIGHPAAAASATVTFIACHGVDGALWYAVPVGAGWAGYSAGGGIIDGPAVALTSTQVTFYVEGLDGAAWHTTRDLTGGSPTGYSPDYGQLQFGVGGSGSVASPYMPSADELLGTSNPAELSASCVTSWGVSCATGNFTYTFQGISIPGRGVPLDFYATYNKMTNAPPGGFKPSSWTHSYAVRTHLQSERLRLVIQENGSAVPFYSNGNGTWTPPNRVLATLIQNADGTFTFQRMHDLITFHFDGRGNVDRETDRNGYVTTILHNNDAVTQVIEPGGRHLDFTYTGNQLTGVADSTGRQITIGYTDTYGNPTTFVDVNGGVTLFGYDTRAGFQNRLLTITDPRLNRVLTNDYDCSPSSTCQVGTDSRQYKYTYSSSGVTQITDPNGNQTLVQHVNNQLSTVTRGNTSPQQATWTFTRDPTTMGITSIRDPNSNVSTTSWDGSGNVLSHAEPSKPATTYTYNAFNQPLTTTDPLGATTSFTYDGSSPNLKSISRAQVQVTTYTHGDVNHPEDVTSLVDPLGKQWTHTYDLYGDQTSLTDPLGDMATYGYDTTNRGWLASSTTPQGNLGPSPNPAFTTTYAHDLFGNLTTVTDPLGHQTARHYDADQNLDRFTDANNNATIYTYNSHNQLTMVTRPDGTVLQTAYDLTGNVTTQTDGANQSTLYGYDQLNRVVSITDPLARSTSYGYDGGSRLVSRTDPGGNCSAVPKVGCTSYGYDPANELTSITYSDGTTPNVSNIQYDADGQRIHMADGTGASSWSYDSLNRMTSSTNGAQSTVGYGYDLRDQLIQLTYPGGSQQVRRGYDDAGRLISVTDWRNKTTLFHPDRNANPVQLDYPNGRSVARTFDDADRLASVSHVSTATPSSTVATFAYTRDANNQVTNATSTGVPPTGVPSTSVPPTGVLSDSTTYSYTTANQIHSAGLGIFTYDSSDNPTQMKLPNGQQFDAANELTSRLLSPVLTTYGYDSRGDRTSVSPVGAPAIVLTYDQERRLTGYGPSARYTYDGDGLRMSKTVSLATEKFAWDEAEGLPLMLKDGTTSYVYGPGGRPLEQIGANGSALYYHPDQLGSTRVLTDDQGAVQATISYDAYGGVSGTTGTASTPLGFAGEYTDAESGLQYLRARYYEPQTGQFLTRDPAEALTRQPYTYGHDNPANISDPSGLDGTFEPDKANDQSGGPGNGKKKDNKCPDENKGEDQPEEQQPTGDQPPEEGTDRSPSATEGNASGAEDQPPSDGPVIEVGPDGKPIPPSDEPPHIPSVGVPGPLPPCPEEQPHIHLPKNKPCQAIVIAICKIVFKPPH